MLACLIYCSFIAIPWPVALGLQAGTVKQTGQHNLSIKRKNKNKYSSLSKQMHNCPL